MVKFLFTITMFVIVVVISGCVTTNNRTGTPVDSQKAYDTHVNLGLTYLNQGNRENSRRHLEKAINIKPKEAAAHHGIGLLYNLTGEVELAEESFLKALKDDRNFTEARVSYGKFLYQQERYQEAYDMFVTASSDISYSQRPLSLTYLGQTALVLGNDVKALSSFEHAVNIDNNAATALIELGDLYFEEKEYAKSKDHLDRYIALSGRTSRSLWLGIRIERIFGNKDREASYALALRNLHPYSKEYLLYKKELQANN